MINATIDAAVTMTALRPSQVEHVNVDTTAQTKAVCHPTNTGFYDRSRDRLVKQARQAGLSIKQSYEQGGPATSDDGQALRACAANAPFQGVNRKLMAKTGRVIREIEQSGCAGVVACLVGYKQAHPRPGAHRPSEGLQRARAARRVHRQRQGWPQIRILFGYSPLGG